MAERFAIVTEKEIGCCLTRQLTPKYSVCLYNKTKSFSWYMSSYTTRAHGIIAAEGSALILAWVPVSHAQTSLPSYV